VPVEPAPGRAGQPGRTALALILAASFMVVLDFSIVNVALPSMQRDLGFGRGQVQWVVTAYAITFGGLLVLGGRAADLFGRRRLFVLGLAGFAVASLAAGLAQGAALLVAARAAQGIAAAAVAPAALSLITAGYREGKERTQALGLYGATASLGFVAGQVLGGVLVEFVSWRAVFLVNVPVGLLAASLALRFIPRGNVSAAHVRLDLGGAALITTATVAAVFAVSEGSIVGWLSPSVLLAAALALGAGIGFVCVERHHDQPLVRLDLLRLPTLSSAASLTFLVGVWNAGEMLVLSLYLQEALHDSALTAGLVIAPQGAVGLVAGLFGARLAARIGLRKLPVLTAAVAALGFIILSYIPSAGAYSPELLAVTLVGFGTAGTTFGATVTAATGIANRDQGVVGGVINTARQIGAAFGAAVLVAIAESGAGAAGTATVSGDRHAMLAAAAALVAAVIAWYAMHAARRPAPQLAATPSMREKYGYDTSPSVVAPSASLGSPLAPGSSVGNADPPMSSPRSRRPDERRTAA
jgi:EmrB/QacA subfamily drug resistance transporter